MTPAVADRSIGPLQKSRHDPHRIAKQAAVTRLVQERCGHGAVQPHHRPVLRNAASADKPRRPVGLDAEATQVTDHQARPIAMLIQPTRHRLQFAADLVCSEDIEYAGVKGVRLAHCRLRRR